MEKIITDYLKDCSYYTEGWVMLGRRSKTWHGNWI